MYRTRAPLYNFFYDRGFVAAAGPPFPGSASCRETALAHLPASLIPTNPPVKKPTGPANNRGANIGPPLSGPFGAPSASQTTKMPRNKPATPPRMNPASWSRNVQTCAIPSRILPFPVEIIIPELAVLAGRRSMPQKACEHGFSPTEFDLSVTCLQRANLYPKGGCGVKHGFLTDKGSDLYNMIVFPLLAGARLL